MTNPNAHDIKVLNGLIDTTLDSADGYREAAEQTQDPHYRTLFERRAGERQQVVEDLSAAVRGLGGDPEPHGSILAKAHRAFLDVKHALLRNDDSVVGSINSGEVSSPANTKRRWRTPAFPPPRVKRSVAPMPPSRSSMTRWRR